MDSPLYNAIWSISGALGTRKRRLVQIRPTGYIREQTLLRETCDILAIHKLTIKNNCEEVTANKKSSSNMNKKVTTTCLP